MKASKTTIYRLVTIFFVFCLLTTTNCRPFDKIMKNQNILTNKIRFLQENSDYLSDLNNTGTEPVEPGVYKASSSSGLSTGAICGIAIPCIAALVGVGAAAAILGGSAAPAAAAALPAAIPSVPVPTVQPPAIPDTTLTNLNVIQPPEIIQPTVQVQPPVQFQPPQPVIKPAYPVHNIEPPVVVQQQVVPQPQMVPVQQSSTC